MSSFPVLPESSFLEDRPPAFEATVSRLFAHKRSVEEVFLTDAIVREQQGHLIAAAQLPRSHALHSEIESGFHDLLLILEIGRQGMMLYGHAGLDVPAGTAFVMSGLNAEVVDVEGLRQGEDPGEFVIVVPFGGEQRNKRGRVRGYSLEGRGEVDGRHVIDFTGEALLIPEALYERVRSVRSDGQPTDRAAPVPVEPLRVGRRLRRNVVVGDAQFGDGELHCAVVTDTTHPSFFDHPQDHVPGMMMLEAARQAALLYLGELGWAPTEAVLDTCVARFSQYAAIAPAAEIRVSRGDADQDSVVPGPSRESLRTHFAQLGQDIGYVDLRLTRVGLELSP